MALANLASDDDFLANLADGKSWEELVAERFRGDGFEAKAAPLRVRPSVKQRRRFADSGDVLVEMPNFTWRFEVKSRAIKFGEDPDSYPYREVFVINVRPWLRKRVKPPAIVLVSQQTRAMLVVPASSEPHWRERAIENNRQRVRQDIYVVDRMHLRTWDELVRWMRTV